MGSYANQIIGLMVGAVLLVAAVIWVAVVTEFVFQEKLPPEAVCPAQWKCVGPPDTRDPDCKCWDKY